MEKDFIEYCGKSYSTLWVDVNVLYPSLDGYSLLFADLSLWDDIRNGYESGDRECVSIDDKVYMYLDYGLIDKIYSESDLLDNICIDDLD